MFFWSSLFSLPTVAPLLAGSAPLEVDSWMGWLNGSCTGHSPRRLGYVSTWNCFWDILCNLAELCVKWCDWKYWKPKHDLFLNVIDSHEVKTCHYMYDICRQALFWKSKQTLHRSNDCGARCFWTWWGESRASLFECEKLLTSIFFCHICFFQQAIDTDYQD